MTVGNRSRLCFVLKTLRTNHMRALIRENTNSGFIQPNIFPWGTNKNGASYQDIFIRFSLCSIGFPEVILVR